MPEGRGVFAAVAPRLQLDAALVDLARAAGAKVHDGHAVEAVDTADLGQVTVTVDGLGPLTAGMVIAADGMWSPTRKLLGLAEPGYLGEWHAFRQYVGGVTGPAAKRLYVWFDDDLLPGYAWSFPLPGDRANVGFGVLRDGRRRIQDMKETWRGFLDRPHVRAALGPHAEPEGRHLAWPIPARIDSAVLAHERVLFVGDAACATDPMTGEGIGQALLTGVLAADAIRAGGLDAPETVRAGYREAVRQHLVADHRMSVALGRILRHRWGARGAVRVAGATEWTRRNFARWLFEDEPRAIAVTPRRWHRRFLDQDGAFLH
jgi:flavin-dependent dehydrogenase